MERINIRPSDTINERFLEVESFYFEIHDLYIRKVVRCRAEVTIIEDDPAAGWKEVECRVDTRCLRSAFCGIEKIRLYKEEKFKVMISFNGVADDLTCLFRSERAADSFMNTVFDWGMGVEKPQTHTLPY